MKIKIISVGKIKEKYLSDGISEYLKRISKYSKIETIEVSDEKTIENPSQGQIELITKTEADRIISKIDSRDFIISLALNGKEFDSTDFAKKINDITLNGYSSITFIIGGSLGLHKSVLDKSNLLLSFSKFTFPHQLMKLILAEQIYRAFRINNNEPYHK